MHKNTIDKRRPSSGAGYHLVAASIQSMIPYFSMLSRVPRAPHKMLSFGLRQKLLLGRCRRRALPSGHLRQIRFVSSHKLFVGSSHEVIPLHLWDTTYRDAIPYHLSRFDNVLDAAMLKSSLTRLLQCDGWRKLGARLGINVSDMA